MNKMLGGTVRERRQNSKESRSNYSGKNYVKKSKKKLENLVWDTFLHM
jgi:hypothetical protein